MTGKKRDDQVWICLGCADSLHLSRECVDPPIDETGQCKFCSTVTIYAATVSEVSSIVTASEITLPTHVWETW